MPRPTPRDVHLDSALSNISIAYRNGVYIAEQVFPLVPVEKQSDYYFVFDKSSWFRDNAKSRTPGTRAQRADYALTTASYIAMPYALAKPVPDEVRDNADNPLNPDVEATEFVTDALLHSQEIRVANLTTGGSGLWAYSASHSVSQWSASESDPLLDIENAINGVVGSIGRQPNVAVMSWAVWKSLKNHPDLLDRVKYTRVGGVLSTTDIASWFGLEKVMIGTALVDTATEGATPSLSYIWGDAFWTGYVPANPGLMIPAAGYLLQWGSRETRRYREEQEHQDVIEASHYTDEVISASDAGAVIYNVV